MEKGSIGAIILIVAVIVGIIAEMAYRQVMETLRREGKEIYVFDHFTYLFKYRKMINEGYLRHDDSKSTYRLYIKSSVLLFCILILGLINIYTDSLLIFQ